jgi:glycosyltransferase involved in cell wall biosynthesis
VDAIGVADEHGARDQSLISVIMPVLNGMPWLEQQLSALHVQEAPGEWEIIVADNGSVDGTRSCVQQWSERDPRIQLVDASARRGPGAARNIGVENAAGRILAFCDADDVVRPGWLAGMVAALDGADLAAGVFDFGSLQGRAQANPVPVATTQMGFLPYGLGGNLAVRRDAFEASGGFSETLMAGEDVDFCWRLQLAGYRFAISDRAVVARREHATGRAAFHGTWVYGQCTTVLYRRYRARGMRPDLRGAAKAWVWLIVTFPGLIKRSRRPDWMRAFGIRAGRLAGSVAHHTFFP